jgi:peptidoglycan/LPS O-acetylase OafA/YrhL
MRPLLPSYHSHRQKTMVLSRSVLDVAYWFYLSFLPSYVRDQLQDEPQDPEKTHATAYLNGFRGVMSLLVFVRHFLLPWFPNLDHGYGQDVENSSWFQLPPIKMLYSGPNVPVFLIVSGYIMTLKPIRLSREGGLPLAWETLASSTFRRAFRIFPLPLFSTFMVMLLVQLGFFDYPYATLPGHIPTFPQRLDGIFQQTQDWLKFVFYDLTNPWTWSTHLQFVYGAHLWTIPLQFRCSLVLFITSWSLLWLHERFRTIILVSLITLALPHGRWDVALYLSGMGLADYDLNRGQESTRVHSSIRSNGILARYLCSVAKLILLGVGVYFSSFPRYRGVSPATGYHFLYSLTNDYHYWHAYGAVLLVCYIGHSRGAQWIFTRSCTRYLGKLSFSLYVVHEPLIHVLGLRTVELSWRLTGNNTPARRHLGIATGLVMTTIVLLWFADLFHYWVDKPSGKIAQWIERVCRKTT